MKQKHLILIAAVAVLAAVWTSPILLAEALARPDAAAVQTPAPGAKGTETAQGTEGTNAWAATVAEDARRLVYDFLSGFTLAGLCQALLVAYLGAKGLRNYTPLGRGDGWLAQALHVINLERRPAASAPPPATPSISLQNNATKEQIP